MRPGELVLRCFAQRQGKVWVAICMDLNLAVQGSSMADAKARLDSVVHRYVRDAFGDEREHLADLFPRPAPPSLWAKYWLLCAKHSVFRAVGVRKSVAKQRVQFFEEIPFRVAAA